MRYLMALVLSGIVSSMAQAASVDEQIAVLRQVAGTERHAIVAANMTLSDDETQAFWPLYREYREAMNRQGDRLVDLLKEYAANYQSMSDDQARDMTEEWFDIQSKQLSTKKKYARKFRRILPDLKVARLMQIENKVDVVYLLDLTTVVPLVE